MLIRHGEHPLFALIDLPEKLREFPQRLGAKDQVHMAVGLLDALGDQLLLGHAAAKADDLLGVFLFGVSQNTHVAEHTLLGVLPDGTGIEDHQIRLLGVLGEGKAALSQHTHQLLAVRHILLAAEGVNAGPGMGLQGGKHGGNFLLKFLLAGKILRRNQYLITFQWKFLQDSIF